MDEYIRRKVLIDSIDKTDWYHVNVQGRLTLGAANEDEALYKATDIYNAIDKIPVADVVKEERKMINKEKLVELIRDCKYWGGCEEMADHLVSNGVTVQQRGHWIVGADGSYMCSECGKVFRYEIGNYCSHCGAKLEGDEDD